MTLPGLFLAAVALSAHLPMELVAQSPRRWVPPPLRVTMPLGTAWKGMEETLSKAEVPATTANRTSGQITTEFVEFSSGPLTSGHIAKVGERPKLLDGDWVRVEYRYEVILTFVEERETLVSVAANIRALKRQFLGGDEWVQISSNGKLEEDLLQAFGQHMFGQAFSLDTPKKGYWERMPSFDQDSDQRPSVVGPERRP